MTGTVTVKQHNVETWKDQAEGRKDKGACPSRVDQMKTTGLTDGEVHHITELPGRTLYASTAGPLPQQANVAVKVQDCPGW